MKKLHTLLCVVCMTILGGFLASLQPTEMKANSYNTISAAPVLSWSPNGVKLPLDLQLDLENKYNKPNEVVIHDTVYQDRIIYKNSKRKGKSTSPRALEKRSVGSTPAINADTLVQKKVDVDREKHTTDSVGPPKGSITLIIDGKVVYNRE